VRAVRAASEAQLLKLLLGRLDSMMASGTTSCEVSATQCVAVQCQQLNIVQL
jgi:hypothetical protein